MEIRHACSFPECKTSLEQMNAKKKCSACMSARYCGKDCQKKDWARHKDKCIRLRKHAKHNRKEFKEYRKLIGDYLQERKQEIFELTHLKVDVEKREGGLFTALDEEFDEAGVDMMTWWDFDQMEEAGFATSNEIKYLRRAFSDGSWIYGFSYEEKCIDATLYKLG